MTTARMSNYCKSILLLACFLLSCSVLSAQEVFTLESAQAYALQFRNEMKMQDLNEQEAEANIKEYWAIGLPKIDVGVDFKYYFEIPTQILPDFITPSVDLRLLQYEVNTETVGTLDDPSKLIPSSGAAGVPAQFGTKFNFGWGVNMNTLLLDGSFLVGLKAQRKYRELISSQRMQSVVDIKYEVSSNFLATLVAREAVDMMEKNKVQLEKTQREMQLTFEAGFIEKLDVDRVTFQLDQINAELENTEKRYASSKNYLKFSMGYPMQNDIEVEGDLEQIYNLIEFTAIDETIDVNQRIEYQLLKKQEDVNDINIKSIKVRFLPRLVGGLTYNQAIQSNDLFDKENEWYPTGIISLGLSAPIWDGGDRRAKVQQAQIDKAKLEVQKDNFERAMRLEVENARLQYRTAENNLKLAKKNMDLAKRIYDATYTKFQDGFGTGLERNQAEIDRVQSQLNFINQLYNLMQARVDLERALGLIK